MINNNPGKYAKTRNHNYNNKQSNKVKPNGRDNKHNWDIDSEQKRNENLIRERKES